ncbi:MAG: hypothetical protein ACTHK2_16495 [Dokdonella sp.]
MRGLKRGLIELYTGLLQLQGYVLSATDVHSRDARHPRSERTREA